MNIAVILVDDDKLLRRATRQTLELAGYQVMDFGSAAEALTAITPSFDGVIVSDVRMPQIDGLQLFARIKEIDADLPVILITGHGDIPMAVQAIQDGAYDFITKPFATDKLVHSVLRAGERRKLVLENRNLRQMADEVQTDMPLIGQTPAIENLRRTIRNIADTNVDVLIAGETGSGKEVVAQLLHDWGQRRKGNFVALNCGALPETVIESELFGHEAGAFTGAQKKRVGRIEHASGGTLFLDEIESMPAATQVKLLRVLEMREITPLGTNEIRPVDLRVVAAAKIDLGDAEQRGDFREDLYYRLNVVTLTIPPLRERQEDIPLLFSHFLTRAARRFHRDIPALDSSTQRFLTEHNWPGNVRELVHFAERFALGVTTAPRASLVRPDENEPLPKRLERFEASLIRETLTAHNGNVQDTLEALGIPRKTFYDKMQRHGISRADYKPES